MTSSETDWNLPRRSLSLEKRDDLVRITFSKILDKNGSLEMGWKLFKSVTSRPGFLIKGETTACLKQDGTQPWVKELFTIESILVSMVSNKSFKTCGGTGSSREEDDFMCLSKSARTGRET